MANNSFVVNKSLSWLQQTTAPSNPTLWQIYSDSVTGDLLQWNGTSWVIFGGGTSSGSKNYITTYVASTSSNVPNPGNGNFEAGTTAGWSLAHTTLSSFFPTSTASAGTAFSSTNGGASANGNLSFTIVSTSQLAGLYSGSLSSGAASTSGDLLISNAFFVDLEDKAKIMGFSFSYESIAGTMNFSGTSSNSFAVYIYDVTNGSWIQPAGVYNLVQGSGAGVCSGTFQTTSNSTQYQIAVVNINATSGAYTLYVDDFFLGPQTIGFGFAGSDTALFTPTFGAGLGTVSNNTGYWRRVGDRLQVWGTVTSGTVTASAIAISLPSGLNIDQTKLPNGSGGDGSIIPGFWQDQTSATTGIAFSNFTSLVFFDGTITNSVFLAQQTSGNTFSKSAGNNTAHTGEINTYWFEVPIAGWSSNTVMSSDTDTRVVAFNVHGGFGSTPGGSALSPPLVDFDTHAGYNSSSGVYTVPVSGYYDIELSIGIPNTAVQFYLYVNGIQRSDSFTESVTSGFFNTGSISAQLNAGDLVTIRPDGTTGSVAKCNLSISRRSGPATVAASETVALRVSAAAGLTTSSGNPVLFNSTPDINTHNAWDVATGKFTSPVTGIYNVSASTYTGGNINLEIRKNGSPITYSTVGTASGSALLTDTVSLNAGDYLQVYSIGTGTTAAANSTSQESNYFNVFRI